MDTRTKRVKILTLHWNKDIGLMLLEAIELVSPFIMIGFVGSFGFNSHCTMIGRKSIFSYSDHSENHKTMYRNSPSRVN